MEDWEIKDYEIRCFNLLLKLGRVDLEQQRLTYRLIKSETKKIMKAEKCDKLAALKRYKTQLFHELIKNRAERNPSKEGR